MLLIWIKTKPILFLWICCISEYVISETFLDMKHSWYVGITFCFDFFRTQDEGNEKKPVIPILFIKYVMKCMCSKITVLTIWRVSRSFNQQYIVFIQNKAAWLLSNVSFEYYPYLFLKYFILTLCQVFDSNWLFEALLKAGSADMGHFFRCSWSWT